MTFKEIRYLIYSALQLIVDDSHLYDVDTHDQAIDIYNDYEVIGIRSEYYDHEEYIVISLKNTANKHFENYLEILDILKNKNIEMELLKSCIKLPDGIIRYNKIWAVSDNYMIVYKDKYLEYEEFNKLKEWLENDK